MNLDLDTQIRNLFEQVEAQQRPVTLIEIQTSQVWVVGDTTVPGRLDRRRGWAVAMATAVVMLLAGLVVFLVQQSGSDAPVITQPVAPPTVTTPTVDPTTATTLAVPPTGFSLDVDWQVINSEWGHISRVTWIGDRFLDVDSCDPQGECATWLTSVDGLTWAREAPKSGFPQVTGGHYDAFIDRGQAVIATGAQEEAALLEPLVIYHDGNEWISFNYPIPEDVTDYEVIEPNSARRHDDHVTLQFFAQSLGPLRGRTWWAVGRPNELTLVVPPDRTPVLSPTDLVQLGSSFYWVSDGAFFESADGIAWNEIPAPAEIREVTDSYHLSGGPDQAFLIGDGIMPEWTTTDFVNWEQMSSPDPPMALRAPIPTDFGWFRLGRDTVWVSDIWVSDNGEDWEALEIPSQFINRNPAGVREDVHTFTYANGHFFIDTPEGSFLGTIVHDDMYRAANYIGNMRQ